MKNLKQTLFIKGKQKFLTYFHKKLNEEQKNHEKTRIQEIDFK